MQGDVNRRAEIPLIIFALCSIPVALSVWVFQSATNHVPLKSLKPQEAVWADVGSVSISGARAVKLDLTWAAPTQVLLAPGVAGVVTAVHISPGQAVKSGVPLIEIDDVSYYSYAAASPLFRDLHRGDSGRDVELLGAYLSSLGLIGEDSEPRTFGPAIGAAVKQFNEAEGYTEPSESFRLASLIWIGPGDRYAAEVFVDVGQYIDGGITPLSSTVQPLVSASVADANEFDANLGTLMDDLIGRELVVEIDDTIFGLENLSGSGISVSNPSLISPLLEAGVDLVEVTLRYKEPATFSAVPSSSIISRAESTCILVGERSARPTLTEVTIVGGTVGIVYLAEAIQAPVIVNPFRSGWAGDSTTCD